jgi:hypothetical protein
VPYDLTRGGTLFHFRDTGKVNEFAFYGQDSFTVGRFTFNYGLRLDQYNGLSEKTGIEPRGGASYLLKQTGHGAARGILAHHGNAVQREPAALQRLRRGRARHQRVRRLRFRAAAAGAAQSIQHRFPAARRQIPPAGRRVFLEVHRHAYDFDVLFDTPITFPISWRKSKLDGVAGARFHHQLPRFPGLPEHGAHARALLRTGRRRPDFQLAGGRGRLPHRPRRGLRADHESALSIAQVGPWIDFTWRFDSGLVAGSVPDLAAALALTADEQAAMGFYCGNDYATIVNRITSCTGTYGATRLVIPPAGTENDDHNPPRIAPHSILDLGIGDDNVLHTEKVKLTAEIVGAESDQRSGAV